MTKVGFNDTMGWKSYRLQKDESIFRERRKLNRRLYKTGEKRFTSCVILICVALVEIQLKKVET